MELPMKINVFLTTAAALASLSAVANAADTTYYDPAPQPQYSAQTQYQSPNWQGAYAGVQLGGGQIRTNGGNDTAMVAGGHAGYLIQRGQFVAGPEVDVNWAGWDVGGMEVDATARARVRAGVAIDNLLVTGSVGYGHMWADGESDGGLSVGAGADMQLSDHIVGGAEYLHTNIGGGADVKTHEVRGRLSYKFN
jgi:opacity protein-like surface antigen